jgi:hypothetical protein
MKLVILLAGILIGVISTLVLTNSVDFLSVSKGYGVSLKDNLNLTENGDVRLTLPKGTKLNFRSQYDDVGEFCLGIVITDLSLVERDDGVFKYFSEQ